MNIDWNAKREYLLKDAEITSFPDGNSGLETYFIVLTKNDKGQQFTLFVNEDGDVFAKEPKASIHNPYGEYVGESLSLILFTEISEGFSDMWHVPTDRTRWELLQSIRQTCEHDYQALLNPVKEKVLRTDSAAREYYAWSDGGFSYFVNVKTGEKKLTLDPDDIEVHPRFDDFCEER